MTSFVFLTFSLVQKERKKTNNFRTKNYVVTVLSYLILTVELGLEDDLSLLAQ